MLDLTKLPPPKPKPNTCWLDDIATRLESIGVDSGLIFEFHENLRDGELHAGGIVVSALEPGRIPQFPWEVQGAFVHHKSGEEIHLAPGNALLVSRWLWLHLC